MAVSSLYALGRAITRVTAKVAKEAKEAATIVEVSEKQMLIGCGLRRGELLALALKSIQLHEEHWVVADLIGKGGHIRTVPIPRVAVS